MGEFSLAVPRSLRVLSAAPGRPDAVLAVLTEDRVGAPSGRSSAASSAATGALPAWRASVLPTEFGRPDRLRK